MAELHDPRPTTTTSGPGGPREGAARCEAGIAAGDLERPRRRPHRAGPRRVARPRVGARARRHLRAPARSSAPRATPRPGHRPPLLLAAPPATPTWEYADARRPRRDPTSGGIRVGDAEVDFAEIRVGATRVGQPRRRRRPPPAAARAARAGARLGRLHLPRPHAGRDRVRDLDRQRRGRAHAARRRPDARRACATLVAQVRADAATEDGQPVWVMLQGEVDGTPLMAAGPGAARPELGAAPRRPPGRRRPVHRRRPTRGFPARGGRSTSCARSRTTSPSGSAACRAPRRPRDGRGRRTLHYYVDSARPTAGVVEAAVAGWTQGRVEVAATPDPAWQAVRHLRT